MNLLRLLGLLLVLGVPALARGSTLPPQSIADLVRLSDRIVLARVVDQRVRVPEGNVRQMTTISRLEVVEEYRGQGQREVELTAQVKGGPARRSLNEILEEIRRANPPPAQQERGKR